MTCTALRTLALAACGLALGAANCGSDDLDDRSRPGANTESWYQDGPHQFDWEERLLADDLFGTAVDFEGYSPANDSDGDAASAR